ncbi:hypothetical protein [Clostridium felsineum]|uniref:hypothetical protein n=1 Tax=Clostridium felsineum TaxID=36839 RepID=UPI00098C24EB|nr:hypothetical protein [Clostridium felsineum]URZ14247.1 hypothetical protein CLFE_002320 [Clostridium felsineum DSM 794]
MENEVILVEVFGVKEEVSCGGCPSKSENSSCSNCNTCTKTCSGGCSSGCGNNKSMYDLYKDFKKYIEKTDVGQSVEVQFIDVKTMDAEQYEYVKKATEKKYMLPVIAINEYIRFYGGMKDKLIYDAIKKELNNQYM